MDGDQKEKGVLNGLKRMLREKKRRNRVTDLDHTGNGLQPSILSSSPIYSDPLPPRCLSAKDDGYTRPYDTASLVPATAAIVAVTSLTTSQPSHPLPPAQASIPSAYVPPTFSGASDSEGETEAAMIMNYLDTVFRLQFACYNPPADEFGRGWLLALLMRTKPLYHAALSLSAYHLHLALLNSNRAGCAKKCWRQMEKHYSLALTELQLQLNNLKSCSGAEKARSSVEMLACINQLISLEVFLPFHLLYLNRLYWY